MYESRVLDFENQAEQLLQLITPKLKVGDIDSAVNLITLKLRSSYEQGVVKGQLYEREGKFPFMETEN